MKSNPLFLSQIEQARRQLRLWRKTRTHREPIPERLWTASVALARVHGVSRVAQALRLNYDALKRRVLGAESTGKSPPQALGPFVELPLVSPSPNAPKCTVELAKGTGTTMTIRWEGQGGAKGGHAPGVSGLVLGTAAFGAARSVHWLVQAAASSQPPSHCLQQSVPDFALGRPSAALGQPSVGASGAGHFGGLAAALSSSHLSAGDLP